MSRTDQRRAAVVALYQHDVTGQPISEVTPRDASHLTLGLIEGVERHQEALDALIERYAEGWSVDRVAALERNILRVALLELIFRSDVPKEVAIDEAVEAAKELCSLEAPKFVNGILGAVAEKEEIQA
ncbi:MAG: transcription antitermination factor NusB [Thermoleophilaceae bacterium]|nr:transcription antitermination factor NusB [Thermoleophilaceae bacterium]